MGFLNDLQQLSVNRVAVAVVCLLVVSATLIGVSLKKLESTGEKKKNE